MNVPRTARLVGLAVAVLLVARILAGTLVVAFASIYLGVPILVEATSLAGWVLTAGPWTFWFGNGGLPSLAGVAVAVALHALAVLLVRGGLRLTRRHRRPFGRAAA